MITKQDVQYLKVFLFFFHSSAIIIISFLPLYFEEIGLSGSKIGLLLAMGPFSALFFQPLWGYLSDRYKTVKKMMFLLFIGVFLSVPILFQTTNIYLLLLVMVVFYSFFSPLGALSDSLAQRTSKQYGSTFGSIRMWGSIGFAVTGIIGGYILVKIGIQNILYPYLFYNFLSFLLVIKISDVKDGSHPITFADSKRVLSNKKFVFFLFFMLLIAMTHRANDTYLGIFISSLGGDESLIGWAWFIAVGSEALIFATSRYWFNLYNEHTLIIISAFLYAVRWFLFTVIETPIGIILLQLLHGITFGVFYLTAFELVSKLVPRELNTTGHLLFTSFFFGLAGIAGSLLGGLIIEHDGPVSLYLYMGIAALLGTVFLFFYRKIFLDKQE